MQKRRKKILLLGAGGREFHNFNVCFRNDPNYEVAAFTATQIPNIANRIYPPELSGPLYPKGIPIFPQADLTDLIKKYNVNEVIFAYSDVSHLDVMHKASEILSLGCDFKLMGLSQTMIKAKIPVISVCAIRTGCGKSKLSLEIAKILRSEGKKVIIVRHPMAYQDLKQQVIQKFEKLQDLDKYNCTIEEREEYEPLIKEGFLVLSGVDYQKILREAQIKTDLILWDGGNNDFPFFKPNFQIVICDSHRPGHEISYHPGETNLRMANLIIINKVNTAPKQNVREILKNIKTLNSKAKVMFLESKITMEEPDLVKNKTVLVIEDGPTVTHGEMSFGAGYLAAKQFGAKKILSPQKWIKGKLKKMFKDYPHLNYVLPAMGYGKKQIKELESAINSIPCQVVLSATPIDLNQIMRVNKPLLRVNYQLSGIKRPLTKILKDAKLM